MTGRIYIIKDSEGNDITDKVRLHLPAEILVGKTKLLERISSAYLHPNPGYSGEHALRTVLANLDSLEDEAAEIVGIPEGARLFVNSSGEGHNCVYDHVFVTISEDYEVSLSDLAKASTAVADLLGKFPALGAADGHIETVFPDEHGPTFAARTHYRSTISTVKAWLHAISSAEAAAARDAIDAALLEHPNPEFKQFLGFLDSSMDSSGYSQYARQRVLTKVREAYDKLHCNQLQKGEDHA